MNTNNQKVFEFALGMMFVPVILSIIALFKENQKKLFPIIHISSLILLIAISLIYSGIEKKGQAKLEATRETPVQSASSVGGASASKSTNIPKAKDVDPVVDEDHVVEYSGIIFEIPSYMEKSDENTFKTSDGKADILISEIHNSGMKMLYKNDKTDFMSKHEEWAESMIDRFCFDLGDATQTGKILRDVAEYPSWIYKYDVISDDVPIKVMSAVIANYDKDYIVWCIVLCEKKSDIDCLSLFNKILDTAKPSEYSTYKEDDTDTVKTDSAAPTDSESVSADLKEFLDSYEAFMDKYVEFMKSYQSDPGNVLSMLEKYTEIMQEYAEFSKKLEKYDSEKMTPADAAYYLEVTTRIYKKMLSIYG